jgi:hypothetical protein
MSNKSNKSNASKKQSSTKDTTNQSDPGVVFFSDNNATVTQTNPSLSLVEKLTERIWNNMTEDDRNKTTKEAVYKNAAKDLASVQIYNIKK